MLTTLSRPQTPKRYATSVDSEFVTYHDVFVWKEHVLDDGTPIDKAVLQKVADNCNRRIDDTNDYVPLVLRHTSGEHDFDPQLVGMAGPFSLAMIGDVDPKWGIVCDMRIFKDDAALASKFPRCSVEFWSPKGRPDEGIFDPIALLAGETPELDLGWRYSRSHEGMVLRRYSRELNLTRYEGESSQTETECSTMISESDIAAIVEQLKPIIETVLDDRLAFLLPENGEPDVTPATPAMATAANDVGPAGLLQREQYKRRRVAGLMQRKYAADPRSSGPGGGNGSLWRGRKIFNEQSALDADGISLRRTSGTAAAGQERHFGKDDGTVEGRRRTARSSAAFRLSEAAAFRGERLSYDSAMKQVIAQEALNSL